MELLTTYGDSVNVEQLEDLSALNSDCLESVKDSIAERESNKLFVYSNKHRALYMYIYRILQPIWDINITSQPKLTELRQ